MRYRLVSGLCLFVTCCRGNLLERAGKGKGSRVVQFHFPTDTHSVRTTIP